jgi:chaperonin GroES
MLKPLADYILVKPESTTQLHTTFGLEIVQHDGNGWNDADKQLGCFGVVIAKGPGKFNRKKNDIIPLQVNIGDRIAFGEYDYPRYSEGTEHYLIIQEADIEGILE